MLKISTFTLILCLPLALTLVGCKGTPDKSNSTNSQTTAQSTGSNALTKVDAAKDKVNVYYFHLTRRCKTCLGIQANIEKTINEKFAKEAQAGAVVFKLINLDSPENKHFTDEFKVSFSSMVVVAQKDKKNLKWENCDKIWNKALDEPALTQYVETQIRTYLNLLRSS